MGRPLGQRAADEVRDAVFRGHRDDVRGGSLQHRHVGGLLRHRGNERHGRGTAADHDHPLVTIVEILGPMLRMHQAALEVLGAGKDRLMTGFVVVVAAAEVQEIAGVANGLFLRPDLRIDCPLRILARPGRRLHTVIEAEVPIDAEVVRRFSQVGQNVRPVRDGLGRLPGAERITQREHVGIGANSGIAKQIPGAADIAASFEDRIALAWAMSLQMVTGPNAGNARTDDQNVEVLNRHVVRSLGKDRCRSR